MASLPRALYLLLATAALGCATLLAQPSPTAAQANVACDAGEAITDAVTGGIGVGSPFGDACEAVSEPVDAAGGLITDPLDDVVGGATDTIFEQITNWVSDGAIWLLGEVATLAGETTTPDLSDPGFLRQYKKMISIAAFMAALMLLAAIFEAIGRGDAGMLGRVVAFNLPAAAIGASVAFLLVGLLVGMVDGLCEAVTATAGADTKDFFKAAIEGLGAATGAGSGAGAVGGGAASEVAKVSTPQFVTFFAAILASFAAFFIWIELLMRDVAIYAVSLFAPLGLAAGIWPRWSGAVRRTAELIFVIVFSKFVIVAILALAASLLAKGENGVESVMAAGALLLLACFSPLVLMKFVPLTEGAIGAAYGRRSAAGGTLRSAHEASFMKESVHRNWPGRGGEEDGGVHQIKTSKATGSPAPKGAGAETGGGGSAGGGGGAGAGAGATGGVAAVAAVPIATAKAAKGAAERLQSTAVAGRGGQEAGPGQRVFGVDKIADRFPAATSSGGQRGDGEQKPSSGEDGAGGGEPAPAPERPPRPAAEEVPRPRADGSKS